MKILMISKNSLHQNYVLSDNLKNGGKTPINKLNKLT